MLALASVLLTLPIVVAAIYVAVPYPTERLRPNDSTSLVITDRNGEVLRVLPLRGGGRADWVTLDQVPPEVVTAMLAGEDQRFFEHRGVDGRAVLRAIGLDLWHRRFVSGASTITMQLVRLVEPHPRTVRGKIVEMFDALRLERALSKREILEQYVNRAYFGNGAFGIEAAAQRYFGKSARALSSGQATLLAVLPRAPSGYELLGHREAALARRAHVLDLMHNRGTLSVESRRVIDAEPVKLTPTEPPRLAPHFADEVLAQLPADVRASGGVVRTTLDARLQRRLERAVRLHLQDRQLDQAGVVIVEPGTGAVRALVGSADYDDPNEGQIDIVTTPRHPGSTLKPFVYALAIETGESPASLARDRLGAVPGYNPNKGMRQHGVTRFREALASSYNLAAVDVLGRVGVPALLERLRRAGLGPLEGSADDYGFDLALGSGRVRLLDLAAAYGFVVDGGRVTATRMLEEQTASSTTLFSPETSWLVMDMLADANARRAAFGAELPLDLPFPVAAKTGTSSGFSDTLAVGATREAIAAAWVGAFDGSGTKGTLAMWSAAPLVRASLLAVADLRGEPLTLPPAPDHITTRDVCRITGLAPGPDCPHKHEHFIAGHEPTQTCNGHAAMASREVAAVTK
jgi:penicillin-binding protein 1C